MKKIGFILVLLAGLLSLVACSKEDVLSEDASGRRLFAVVMPASETKTCLGTPDEQGRVNVLWKTGDRISVNGVLSEPLPSADEGKSAASFVVDGQLSAPYQVLYPGTTSENTITLPSNQTYVENSFDPSAGAAYGNATYAAGTYSVTLRNFCGLIRLALKGSATLDRIVVHALGEETIAGDFVLESDADGFTGVFSGGGSPSLVYACEGQTLGETVRYFFIALPARTYSSGMEALVYQADGKYMRLKFWGDGKTLGASDIVAFEEKTYVAGRWDVLGELPALPQEESHFDTHLTVGSYNIWSSDMRTLYYTNRNNAGSEYYSGSGDGYMVDGDPRLWDTAKSYMAQTIANIAYDVFGLSEVSVLQKAELPGLVSAAGGSHYTWKFFLNSSVNDDSTPAADDEYEAIVYNNRLFTCERTGKFWLTDKDYGLKPHQGVTALSASDGNYRLVEYAFLTHNVTRKTFLFCHCHAPLNDAINEWAGGIIQYRITGQGSRTGSESSSYPINRNGYPVIFVGDLNATPSEGLLYSKLSAFWNCAYDQARETGMLAQSERENPGTWSNWRMQQSMLQSDDKRMDHVFVSSEFTVTRYWTNRFRYQAPYAPAASGFRRFYPSDHVPIVAELSL